MRYLIVNIAVLIIGFLTNNLKLEYKIIIAILLEILTLPTIVKKTLSFQKKLLELKERKKIHRHIIIWTSFLVSVIFLTVFYKNIVFAVLIISALQEWVSSIMEKGLNC